MRPKVDSRPSGNTTSKIELGAVLLASAAVFLLPLAGSSMAVNPNEVVRLQLTTSMAFFASFDITDTLSTYGTSEDVSIRNGRIYSDKAPGLSMVGVPAVWMTRPLLGSVAPYGLPSYWPMRHTLTLLLVSLPTIVLVVLVANAVARGDPSRRSGYIAIAALTTPLLTYGTVFFGHAPAAFLVTCSWLLLLGPPGREAPVSSAGAVLGGFAAGLAVATEYPTVLIVAVVFSAMVARRQSLGVLALTAAGALLGLLPTLWYHQVAFGAPWLTGYSFKASRDFQIIIATGYQGITWPTLEALWGVLGSARRGLFFFSPFLLLASFGALAMARQRGGRTVWPAITAIVVYIAFAAGFVDWTAGWCAAARHLTPVVPLLLILSLSAIDMLVERTWGLFLVTSLVVVSTINTLLTLALTPFFPPVFSNPLTELVLPSLIDGAGAPNFVSSVAGLPAVWVWVATAGVAVAIVIGALARVAPRSVGWIVAMGICTGVFQALIMVQMTGSVEPHLERFRAQTLAGLGHDRAAARIEAALDAGRARDR